MDKLHFFLSLWLLFKVNITTGKNYSTQFRIRPILLGASSESYQLPNHTSTASWPEWKEPSSFLPTEASLIDSTLQFTDSPNEASPNNFIRETVLSAVILVTTKSLEANNATASQANTLQSTVKMQTSFSSHLLRKNTSIIYINVTASTSYPSLTKASTSNRSVAPSFSNDLLTRSASRNDFTATKPSNFLSYSSSMNFSTSKLSNLHTPPLEIFPQSTQYISSSQHTKSSIFIANTTTMQPMVKSFSYHQLPYFLNKSHSFDNSVLPRLATSNSQHNIRSSSSITSFNIHKSSSLRINSSRSLVLKSSTILPFNIISFSKHSQRSSIYPSSLLSSLSMNRESSSTRKIHLYPSRSSTLKSSNPQISTTIVKNNDNKTKLGGKDAASLPVWIAIILAVGAFLVITVISAVAYKYVQWNKDHGDYTLWVSNLELKPVNARNAEVLT